MNLRLALDSDLPALRRLVNTAYKELADMGLNYTASYQDEEITRDRIGQGRAFVLEAEGEIVATVLFTEKNHLTGRRSAYISQLAVVPRLKRSGIGTKLVAHCERLAQHEGFDCIQLDTAKPAVHLVSWYERLGYQIVGEEQWEGKTYASWIFEKDLSPARRVAGAFDLPNRLGADNSSPT